MNPRPLFKVLNHRQERFRFNLFLSNVIYIEIGCNKVNTKNENIFNFIDGGTVCFGQFNSAYLTKNTEN